MDQKKIDDAVEVIEQLRNEHANCKELKIKMKEIKEMEKRKCDEEIKIIEDKHAFKLEALKIASAEIVLEMTNKSDNLSKLCKEKDLENSTLQNENVNLKEQVHSLEGRVTQLEEKVSILLQNAETFRNLYDKQNTRIDALLAQISSSQQT